MTLTGDFVTGQTVSFQRMRALLLEQGGGLQEGVVGATDLQVIQRAAGANMSVDVGAGAAWVQVDTGTRNGLAHVYNDASANVVVSASNGTNPRIDQIILRYNDASIPTGSGNVPTLEVLTGTATSGATLDNRTGAAALPNDCLRLADLLIPTSSTSVTTANIRDRRPWARGALVIGTRSPAVNVPITTAAELDTTNWKFRVECSGAPMRLSLSPVSVTIPSAGNPTLSFWMDGGSFTGSSANIVNNQATTTFVWASPWSTTFAPAAGSHLLSVAGVYTGGASPPSIAGGIFTIEEILRPNASNT